MPEDAVFERGERMASVAITLITVLRGPTNLRLPDGADNPLFVIPK